MLASHLSKTQSVRREFKSLPLIKVQDCQDDQTQRIQGKRTLIDEPLSASLSNRKCAVYRIRVDEYKSGKNRGYWRKLIEDERSSNFLIQDGSHHALILSEGATFLLNKDANFKSGIFNDADDKLNQSLTSFGEKSTGLLGFNKSLRYQEGILEEKFFKKLLNFFKKDWLLIIVCGA